METAAGSPRIHLACRQAFSILQDEFRQRLRDVGIPDGRSEDLAAFITASIEGGTILSRTNHIGDPLLRNDAELAGRIEREIPRANNP